MALPMGVARQSGHTTTRLERAYYLDSHALPACRYCRIFRASWNITAPLINAWHYADPSPQTFPTWKIIVDACSPRPWRRLVPKSANEQAKGLMLNKHEVHFLPAFDSWNLSIRSGRPLIRDAERASHENGADVSRYSLALPHRCSTSRRAAGDNVAASR